jgi:hypothetical protein
LLAHGRWFSQGTPVSSTTKTCRHDIAEILLKVALTTKNQSTNKKIAERGKIEHQHTSKRLLNDFTSFILATFYYNMSAVSFCND